MVFPRRQSCKTKTARLHAQVLESLSTSFSSLMLGNYDSAWLIMGTGPELSPASTNLLVSLTKQYQTIGFHETESKSQRRRVGWWVHRFHLWWSIKGKKCNWWTMSFSFATDREAFEMESARFVTSLKRKTLEPISAHDELSDDGFRSTIINHNSPHGFTWRGSSAKIATEFIISALYNRNGERETIRNS